MSQLLKPGFDTLAVGGVTHNDIGERLTVDKDVVDHASSVRRPVDCTGSANRQPGDVVGRDAFEPVENTGPVESQPAHVADVEKPHPLADRLVLVDDGRVLDGHRPAAELDKAPAICLMPCIERSLE